MTSTPRDATNRSDAADDTAGEQTHRHTRAASSGFPISRRTAIRSGALLATSSVLGVGASWYGTQTVLAAEHTSWVATEDEVEIKTLDGTINEIRINPVMDIAWANVPLEHNPAIHTTVRVKADTITRSMINDVWITVEENSGEVRDWLEEEERNILDDEEMYGDPIEDTQFFADDGASETATLDVSLRVELVHYPSNDIELLDEVQIADTVDITVHNVDTTIESVHGSFSTVLGSETEVNGD